MAKAERAVETHLHNEFKKLGGTTRKWTSPGRDGVPDRICIAPGGLVYMVEVKTVRGKLSVRQQREIKELQSYGCNVHVVYGLEGVNDLIKMIKERHGFA